ncbi:MAG: WG repeat-containing protein [Bacteroidales bacterium]|nr:WG repeat-containing protein [Bacteroidales bacterium]
MIKKAFLFLAVILPLMTVAQNKPLTAKQSKAHLEALKKLSKDYGIDNYVGNDTYIAVKLVDKNSYYGLVTIKGEELLPFEYDYVQTIKGCNLLAFIKDTIVGFADRDGHIVAPLQYNYDIYGDDGEILSTRGLLAVRRNGKYGVIDTNGRTVLPFRYDDYLSVCPDAPFVYVDKYNFSDGTKTESLIHYNGDTIITAGDLLYLTDGVMSVTRNGLVGLYDTNGREIAKCQYEVFTNSPSNGIYSAKKNGRWMLVDLKGKEHFTNALRHINDRNYLFYGKSGLIFHYDDDMCGAIDTKGRTIIPLDPRYGFPYYYDGSSRVVMSNIDRDTAFVFDFNGRLLDSYSYYYNEYEELGLEPQYIVVEKDGLKGIVDSDWNLITPFKFKGDMDIVDNNHFVVQLADGIKGLVDTNGDILFKVPCHWITSIGNGIYRVYTDNPRNNKEYIKGFCDIYGNTTLTKEEYATMQLWQIHRE